LQLAAINTLLLILVPMLVRFTSGATLAEFGLSLVDWRRQLAIGVTAALLMTPVVIAIQIAAVQIWRSRKHPVEEMILDSFSPGIAMLAVVSTMVLAPMIEELLFRAIVQRWLTQLVGSGGSSGSLSKDQVVAEPAVGDLTAQIDVASTGSGEAKRTDQEPLFNPAGPEPRSYLAIVSTSLFFAAMHAAQWPAPIAIFILSVALGTLYHRTGSLLSAIAMHGTFNGYSTLLLLHQALSRQIDPNHAAQQVEPVAGFISYLISCV
jgi:membrane protease YdiL (CAAX protease family)